MMSVRWYLQAISDCLCLGRRDLAINMCEVFNIYTLKIYFDILIILIFLFNKMSKFNF